MTSVPNTRTRMIQAAAEALQRRGVAGMSFTEVLASSSAARGAIYHHFPAGKSELVAEAATLTGQQAREAFLALPADGPADVVRAFTAAVRPVVAASARGGGCAVAAVTVDADLNTEELRSLASAAFNSWIDALTGRLTSAGLARADAKDVATTLVTLLEGAHVLCRAAGSLRPFDRAARAALRLVADSDAVVERATT